MECITNSPAKVRTTSLHMSLDLVGFYLLSSIILLLILVYV